jgi:YfiH family protein
VFYLDSRQIYRVPELDWLDWLIHGFGTRHSDIPGLFTQLATVKQVHSSMCVAAGGRRGVVAEADALLENRPGAVVAVKTADCIPVLLADERNRAVAAVHAGWRGTVAHIVERAVEGMSAAFGTRAADLHAAIGPGIGKCCYEVGPEVSTQFGLQGRAHLDLAGENRQQLINLGILADRVYVSDFCTMCRPEFHSFRRDKEDAGRMYSFIGITAVH